MTVNAETPTRIEQHTIYQIPLNERHGRARDLFTIWFGSNIMMLTIVTGALATTVFKLPFLAAVGAIALGNLVGAVFMALHAAQGPRLGVPQMVQTRGQFGSIGAVLVVGVVVAMYVGFLASNIVLGGQSLHVIARGIPVDALIAFVALVSVIATMYGHDLIHAYARVLTILSGLALLATFIWLVFVHGLPAGFLAMNHYSTAGFFSMVSVGALWQIAYAPYVSDYSRYMPQDTGAAPTFWASYWGCALGSILPMTLGALLGLMVVDKNLIGGLARLTGPASVPIIVIFSVGIAGTNAMNLYCGVLSTITLIQTFKPDWKAGPMARIAAALGLTCLGLGIAFWGAEHFLANYTNFILLLLYVLVPWTAINLVDFYLVQHGDYDVASFFASDGGVYGRYNRPAIFCYLLGIVIQTPFVATDLYTGPVAKMLGGVDISWVIGIAVIGPVYYVTAKRFGVARPALKPA
ncbi:MAG TPA: cytosine permease [Caulobacteraceae bacterium]|jgi:NCS1 family nucleobase:cation symporter-1